jgi:hypothetical protein
LRRRSGESYVAGGAALNELIGGRRVSDDLDIFHEPLKRFIANSIKMPCRWRSAYARRGLIVHGWERIPSHSLTIAATEIET